MFLDVFSRVDADSGVYLAASLFIWEIIFHFLKKFQYICLELVHRLADTTGSVTIVGTTTWKSILNETIQLAHTV